MKMEEEAVAISGMENAEEVFVSIPIVTMAWLRDEENGFEWRGEFLIHVEGRHTVSPYEFYGRLLKYETTTARLQLEGVGEGEEEHLLEGNMIVAANDRLIHFAGELNAFYGQKKNRQQIEAEATKRALSNGQRIYGIVEVEDDRAEFTGLWQRVQILGLCQQSRFARVRYLDSGGSDIRPLSSVLRIYPAHCQRAPFCIQFCYHGVRPMRPPFHSASHLDQFTRKSTSHLEKFTWSQQAIMKFRQLMREDVPISLSLWGRLNKCHENEPYEYNTPSWRLPDVMFVMSAKARGMDKNINSLMLEPPGGNPIAVKDDSMPVPSPIDLSS